MSASAAWSRISTHLFVCKKVFSKELCTGILGLLYSTRFTQNYTKPIRTALFCSFTAGLKIPTAYFLRDFVSVSILSWPTIKLTKPNLSHTFQIFNSKRAQFTGRHSKSFFSSLRLCLWPIYHHNDAGFSNSRIKGQCNSFEQGRICFHVALTGVCETFLLFMGSEILKRAAPHSNPCDVFHRL